jgi:hypothetical protein
VRTRNWSLILATLASALACVGASASANPPRLADLRVADDRWHADNYFVLDWTEPPNGAPPLVAVHYRIRNPQGIPIQESRLSWPRFGIGGLTVPGPGIYSAEVWLEDAAGGQGPAATAQLRFDDTRPAAIEPLPAPDWLGRTAFPLRIRLSHPPGPPPIAGIRGYAVTIGTAPGGAPCAAADRCTDAETTLHGGAEADMLTIATLPEGLNYLQAVAVSGSGMTSANNGRAVLRVDTTSPLTALTGAPPDWTREAVRLVATATDAGSGMQPDGTGPPPFTAIRVDGGAPAIELGPSASARVIDEGTHLISYYARDSAGNVDDGAWSNGIANRDPGTAWVRIDRTPPALVFSNSQDPRDPDLLRVQIADRLSGADLSRGWIGVRPKGSDNRFERLLSAAPENGELRARWDSDSHPLGEYEFRAIGYDIAGNSTVTTRRRNSSPMILSNPLKATTALSASFGGGQLALTVPYGRGIRLSGRLTTGIRSPLGGMPVRIVERLTAGPGPAVRASTVRTEPGGAYSIRLPAGPSRDVAVTFAGSAMLSRSTSGPLRLRVRSAVRLWASSAVARVGGAPLVFRGRVLAPAGSIPPAGKSIQLQFRLVGLPWSEFRTVQTDRRGRFRYAYRFSDDDSRGARFQFRAFAPAQDGWPYEPGGSRPVVVRGY